MDAHARCVAAVGVAALGIAQASGATLIEAVASGVVESVEGSPTGALSGVGVGDAWSATVVYDAFATPIAGQAGSSSALYRPATDLSIVAGGVEAVGPAGAGMLLIGLLDGEVGGTQPTRDELFFTGDFGDLRAAVTLRDFDRTALDTVDLPTALDFEAFEEAVFTIRDDAADPGARIEGRVESLTLRVVPAPGAAALLALACPLACARRRRWRDAA